MQMLGHKKYVIKYENTRKFKFKTAVAERS